MRISPVVQCWLFCTPLLFSLLGCATTSQQPYITLQGKVFGTYYTIQYQSDTQTNYQKQIEALFVEFDNSLSTYNSHSIISRINQNDPNATIDHHFETMYQTAQSVHQETEGAFDITVAPLVSAWGFGAMQQEWKEEPNVQPILPYVGMQKITLQQQQVNKTDPRIQLDASAIAKGQSCDVVSDFLDKKGCQNYMIEIGGEIVCRGVNPKNSHWKIGIDKPHNDPANERTDLQTIVGITNVAMATSGNYRQYYYKNNKKYAHTIDPRTGYPVQHNLLSATVIADRCIVADAYATACMVLGVKKSLQICEKIDNLDCYLIFENKQGEMEVAYTQGFQKYLTQTQ